MPNQQKFINYFAKYISCNYNLNQVNIIVPTSIAKSSIKSALLILPHHEHIHPTISTLEEFCYNVIGYQKADDLELTLVLSKILFNIGIKKNFSQLYFLSRQILEEFNEIDTQLVNINDYFKHISQYHNKFIGNTNITNNISINVIETIYKTFKKYLEDLNICYPGLAFRLCVNHPIEKFNLLDQKILITGFNQLTISQKLLFTILKKENNADFFWDYDDFYIKNPIHEAGYYIRELMKSYPAPITFSTNYNNKKLACLDKHLSIIKSSNILSELRNVTQILKNELKPILKTAIIINKPDYIYLFSDHIKKLNLNAAIIFEQTIKNTQLNSFLDLLYNFNQNINQDPITRIKHLSKHNYIKEAYNQDFNKITTASDTTHLHYFINLNPLFAQIIDNNNIHSPKCAIKYLINIFNCLLENTRRAQSLKSDKTILNECLIYLKKLNDIITEDSYIADSESLKLIITLLKSHKIPKETDFNSTDLILITSLEQTLLLDFDNVIFVDMNETNSTFTQTNNLISTYNIKKVFKLRTFEDNNRAESYLFYRLCQSAKSIYLTYKEHDIDSRAIEPNRYIKQIKYENIFNNIVAVDTDIPLPYNHKVNNLINKNFFKSVKTLQLDLSASKIIDLLECDVKFFFKSILKIRNDTQRTNIYSTIGSAFHKIMECIYKEYEGQIITDSIINEIKINRVEPIINDILNIYTDLRLIEKITLMEYVNKTLEYDLKKTPFKLKHVELLLSHTINLKVKNRNYNITISGIIDRIDEYNDSVEIIDYKTGDAKTLSIDATLINAAIDDFPDFIDGLTNYRVQVLIYYLLYIKTYKDNNKTISVNLLNIKKLFNDSFPSAYGTFLTTQDTSYAIEKLIVKKLENLFNYENNYIEQCIAKDDLCIYCEYKNICNF